MTDRQGAESKQPSRASSSYSLPLWILAAVAAAFFLRTARDLLIPIALAILISFALEPAVTWLARHRVPRLAGTTLVMAAIVAVGAAAFQVLRVSAMQALELVPQAAQRAREVILPMIGDQAIANGGRFEAGALIEQAAGSILTILANVVVIFFLVFFLLISGHRVRDRVIEISGRGPERRQTTATIINEINGQIQQYLLVLLVTAIIVSLATWAALAWMGVPQAALWGILAGVFNSIPYFGPVIVSGGLFLVGIVQGSTVVQAIQMAGIAIVITSLEGWLLTPPLMGRAERMNALTVFIGLLLWSWLWGGWGTVLAVPMLAVIKSVADHTERFKAVGRLMAP